MRENPKVCLEVEEIGDKSHWTTVLVIGRYEEIHQDPEGGRGAQTVPSSSFSSGASGGSLAPPKCNRASTRTW